MTGQSVEHATFTIQRSYDAPPAAVFAAFASAEGKRGWFAEGEGWTIESFELDFRPGGRERSAFRFGDGPGMGNETVFLDIAEGSRIVFAYSMLSSGKPFSASLATVELVPEGAGTRLVYTEQAAFFEGADRAEMREGGWRELLDRLGKALAARQAA